MIGISASPLQSYLMTSENSGNSFCMCWVWTEFPFLACLALEIIRTGSASCFGTTLAQWTLSVLLEYKYQNFCGCHNKLPWFLQLHHCYKFCIGCIDLVHSVIAMEASVLVCCMVSNNILDLEYNPKNIIKKVGWNK